MLAGWSAPKRTTPGGQPRYSNLAIKLVLTLRLVFHLAWRQADGFARRVLRLLRLELSVPDNEARPVSRSPAPGWTIYGFRRSAESSFAIPRPTSHRVAAAGMVEGIPAEQTDAARGRVLFPVAGKKTGHRRCADPDWTTIRP